MCKTMQNNTYECNGSCPGGTVWGSVVYTADSNIWAAARHMGFLPGAFIKVPYPGLTTYAGSTMNGVTTNSYGNYGSSYYLVRAGSGSSGVDAGLAKSLSQRVESLQKVEESLSRVIKMHENRVAQVEKREELREKELRSIEGRIQSHLYKLSEGGSDSSKHFQRDLLAKIKDVFCEESRKSSKILVDLLNPKGSLYCTVCLESKREAMVMPCNHAHFCGQCLQKCLQEGKCRVCEGKIVGYMMLNL